MSDKSLNKYLDEIGRTALLSDSEEQELSDRIRQGDNRAMNRLVESNLRFVVKTATQYRGQGVAMEDLVSEGNIGMMSAALKFDAHRGVRFVSYAAPFVRRQIERAIEVQNGIYKIPQKTAHQESMNNWPISVDAPLNGRSNLNLLSVLVNADSPRSDGRVYGEEMERAVEHALQRLTPCEWEVVSRFYGLDREHETLFEIAEDLQMKRERVRQIRNKAVRRLRRNFRHELAKVRE
jgi:RNA polymerase primary sigma factor